MTQAQIVTFSKAGGPEVMTLSEQTITAPKAGQVALSKMPLA